MFSGPGRVQAADESFTCRSHRQTGGLRSSSTCCREAEGEEEDEEEDVFRGSGTRRQEAAVPDKRAVVRLLSAGQAELQRVRDPTECLDHDQPHGAATRRNTSAATFHNKGDNSSLSTDKILTYSHIY